MRHCTPSLSQALLPLLALFVLFEASGCRRMVAQLHRPLDSLSAALARVKFRQIKQRSAADVSSALRACSGFDISEPRTVYASFLAETVFPPLYIWAESFRFEPNLRLPAIGQKTSDQFLDDFQKLSSQPFPGDFAPPNLVLARSVYFQGSGQFPDGPVCGLHLIVDTQSGDAFSWIDEGWN